MQVLDVVCQAIDMKDLCSSINAALLDKGASLVGFADLIQLPADSRGSMRFGVSIGVALEASVIAGIRNGPTQQYYAEYRRANVLLWNLAKLTRSMIEAQGWRAIAKAPTHEGIDPRTQSTVLPHKTVATKAGLGWIGKCALLVNEKYGSAVRITTVLTDAELVTAVPVESSRCGDCAICVDSCPGHAPSGEDWTSNRERGCLFDAFACAGAARKQAVDKLGVDDTICGICIAVCPWTVKYLQSRG